MYTVRLHDDRIDLDWMYKHHDWDDILTEFKLVHEFNTGSLTDPFDKRANFMTPAAVRLCNNFEENAADGEFLFRDPWYVEGDDQPDILIDVDSPHIPTGKSGASEPAAFLNQNIVSGRPYYSAEYPTLLATDRSTEISTPLARGEWSLIDVFARDPSDAVIEKSTDTYGWIGGRWQRTPNLDVDVKFSDSGADVFGFYKAHMQATHEIPPTQGNSQRKIAVLRWSWDSLWYHAVYVSGGRVWYTWTEDNGDTWNPEVLISDFHHTAGRPCIAIKNEVDPLAMNGAVLYITYVDESDGTVVLKSRAMSGRPDQWYTVDEISVANPLSTHPVVSAASYCDCDGRYCMLVYEGDSTIQYSVYSSINPLIGEEKIGQSIVGGVTFRDRVLEDGFVNWRGRKYQPTLPSISFPRDCIGVLDFDVIWREGDLAMIRNKRVTIDEVVAAPTRRVINPPATFVPTNNLTIATHAGPSLASQCLGNAGYDMIAYEFLNQGTFPSPALIPSQGLSILGRTFMPVTSRYPGGAATNPNGQIIPGNRVAILRHVMNQHSNPITRVLNLPYSSLIRPEPSVNFSMVSGQWTVMASMNFTGGNAIYNPKTATVKFPLNMPSSISAQHNADGYYPSIAEGYKPLQIHCGPEGIWAANYSSPSPIQGDDILHNVFNTTQGLRKSASLEISDPLRELVIRKNDSSYALFGMVKPHVINSVGDYTEVAWDFAADSSEVLWWHDLPACIRTTGFSVPTNGAFEYGNELFATYPADLDSSAVIQVQFRDTETHAVLMSTSIDMSEYQGDTALYVLDRYDLSDIAGQTVYMCIDLADTTSIQSWEVQVVTAIDTVQQQKQAVASNVLPTRVFLEHNAPNPFNPVTTIRFGIEEDRHVELRVFDQFGRTVATLVNGRGPAGRYNIQFEAGTLPSGVYYYRLTTDEVVIQRKMLLIR